MSHRPLTIAVLFGAAAVALAGCSIAPLRLDGAEIGRLTGNDFQRVTLGQEAISGSISVYEAIARALKYNLDSRVEQMSAALRLAETGQASADMLPQLAAKAGYSARDSDFQTSSLDIPTGTEVKQNLVTTERTYNDGDVTFSWNVLDFALSYVRARQAADTYLVQQETRRRVIQRIIEDTRTAYWRAVSADRMARRLKVIERRAATAIASTRESVRNGAEAPLTGLTYERELVTIRQTAERLEHELNLARAQLAALMDVPPGTPFRLVDQDIGTPHVALGLSADEMVAEAVFNRAEIREIAYQSRINEQEATAALLDVLPGLKLYGSDAFNDDQFLLHNDWVGWGVAASDNLMKLARLPAKREAVAAEHALLDQKALATTMVVMTQVHVSRIRYQHYSAELQTAKDYLTAQKELVRYLRAEVAADLVGQQTLIREEMNELVAEVQRDIAYGNVQNAASSLLVSMGLDVQAREIDLGSDVKSLAAHLQSIWVDRVALSDRAKYLAELERQREEVRRRAAEEERRRHDEAQRIKDEQVRAAKAEAQAVKDQAAKAKRDAETAALVERKRVADAAKVAREEARKARKTAVGGKASPKVPREVEWRWPWEAAGPPPGLKDDRPASRPRGDAAYTGTK